MSRLRSLLTHPVHLGLGATALPQPEMTGMEWYEAYAERVAADGAEGRLVSMYDFDADWDNWEMHPRGDELVVCLEGEITLHQEMPDGSRSSVTLGPGDYAVNAPGVWHTADVAGQARALFITAGEGTAHRPR
ncbi:cupin domain-containing protein [Sphingomicrobium flavum]|uniref:cupin domain-containing protein n=1 Tax=Sphingomicrobium flavum TaxID=1229164 RepID=UPI0021ADC3B8|nr:cupin domain-containing protein [Sphingomicrobium flavum]